ncbi:hypothetical protein [Xanthomonas arboricola]|uniref:hypothetical protein n=1 Tax=Xanthomonas arboricola TaxID=56448 RepID=UPI001C0EBFA3|nr:hypothetical protein [Xanthomonas arboricola]
MQRIHSAENARMRDETIASAWRKTRRDTCLPAQAKRLQAQRQLRFRKVVSYPTRNARRISEVLPPSASRRTRAGPERSGGRHKRPSAMQAPHTGMYQAAVGPHAGLHRSAASTIAPVIKM